MDTLTTPWPPSIASGGADQTPRVLTNHFTGDATAERLDGLNASPITYRAVWDLWPPDATALVAFLRAHACDVFWWIMPRETAARQWEAVDWERTSVEVEHDQVQVTFEERFKP